MASVQLKNLEKVYGGSFKAVHGINLDVEDGEFMVFVGPSGCAKSTTLRMVAGLEEITGGEILIGDQRVNDLPPGKRSIAMVFQNYALYPHMSVAANIGYALKVAGVPKAERQRRIEETAKIVGLSDYLERKPAALSGGQRQRVAIARALIADPEVLLLDEPTSALDVSVQAEILNLLQDLRAARNLTYILVSHNLAVIAHLCPQVGVMLNGEMVEQLSAGDLREGRTKHPHTEELRSLSIRLEEPA